VSAKGLSRRAAFRLATSDRLEQIVMAAGPLRGLAFRQAQRYVSGLDEQAALATTRTLEAEGLSTSIDLFGENVTDEARAEQETLRYLGLAQLLAVHPGTYVSLDCSHLGLDEDPLACRRRVERIAAELPAGSRLQLGAEESWRVDPILDLAQSAAGEGLPIMVTVSANLGRSPRDVEVLARARVPIRLVKGAYVEPAQVAHPWGDATDRAFIELAGELDRLGADHSLATHDQAILTRLLASREGAELEFLLGVRPDDARRLARDGHRVRIYVPYGERWFRYYARRVAESIGA
jgi:proline dehydrogenase